MSQNNSILADLPSIMDRLMANMGVIIEGYRHPKVRLVQATIARGNVLVTSPPGLAKTTLMATLQASIAGAVMKRLQYTPDTLPQEIKGFRIFNQETGKYEVSHGAMWGANFYLADEINRAPATTHAPMLEAMQEGIVTIGGVVYQLPRPFVVMATQNPIEQEGTFNLPEAQQDRFMYSLQMTYQARAIEVQIAKKVAKYGSNLIEALGVKQVVALEDIVAASKAIMEIDIPDNVLGYAIDLCRATRPGSDEFIAWAKEPADSKVKFADVVALGASPRSYINLIRSAQALAGLTGASHCTHEHIKRSAYDVLRHRILRSAKGENKRWETDLLVEALLANVPTAGTGLVKDKVRKEDDEAAAKLVARRRSWFESEDVVA